MDHSALHERARSKGVQPIVYWVVRAVLQPFFRLYFRLTRIGCEYVPTEGPVIVAANHRSFLDPFVIACIARRPLYYVAKRELFERSWQGWLLNALGAFPVDRGTGDTEMLTTARGILERGDAVLIFPEGTRMRPGSLGSPRRGVGRLALETGAPVVPVAIIGTEAVRRGWRIRPHKVRLRCGRPLTFPCVPEASPELAATVTERIWLCVMLQWEWLGGLPPLRRAAVIGAGEWGTGVAAMLARAGIEVDLAPASREALPAGIDLPEKVRALRAAQLELSRHDLVVFATGPDALPASVAEHAPAVAPRAGVLVRSEGLVGPLGAPPTAYVAERTLSSRVAALGLSSDPLAALEHGAALVIGTADRGLGRQLRDVFAVAGFDTAVSPDPIAVDLAGAAASAAALAAALAGPAAAGAAAGKVFAEVADLARSAGWSGEALAGVAGTGSLVAALGAPRSSKGAAAAVPLLSERAVAAGVDAPVLRGLAEVVDAGADPGAFAAALTAPPVRKRARAA